MTKNENDSPAELVDAEPTTTDSALIKTLEGLAFKIQGLADKLLKMLPGQ